MSLDLEDIYKYHVPREGRIEKYEGLRPKVKEIAEMIAEFCPISKEQSIAFTSLKIAVMWASAAIACKMN